MRHELSPPGIFLKSSPSINIPRFRTHSRWMIWGITIQSSASQSSSPPVIIIARNIGRITFSCAFKIGFFLVPPKIGGSRIWRHYIFSTFLISPTSHTSTCWTDSRIATYRSSIANKCSRATIRNSNFIIIKIISFFTF